MPVCVCVRVSACQQSAFVCPIRHKLIHMPAGLYSTGTTHKQCHSIARFGVGGALGLDGGGMGRDWWAGLGWAEPLVWMASGCEGIGGRVWGGRSRWFRWRWDGKGLVGGFGVGGALGLDGIGM